MQKWQCRIASSLGGGFAGTPNEVWGTLPYTNPGEPCVFFGMYGLRDVEAIANHYGDKMILWAGSDILNAVRGYWIDKNGKDKINPGYIAHIFKNFPHYVENQREKLVLESMGVYPAVVPSFLGNVNNYQPQQIRTDKKRYYTSVSGDDFELYGWNEIPDLAKKNPDTEYHLYGNKGMPYPIGISDALPNVFIHGRVSQEQMDAETKTMTGALRLTRFDGASEILVKSTLWGQTPLSPYIHYDWLGNRDKLLSVVNKYPWNAKVNQ